MLKLATATIAALVLFPLTADAQYAPPPPNYGPGYYAPTPVAPPPPRERRLGVGLHLTAGNLAPADDAGGEALDASGGGLHLIYRLSPALQIGVNLESLTSEGDTAYSELATAGLELTWRINPFSEYVWSITGGIGAGEETAEIVSNGVAVNTFEFAHAYGEIGADVARRFGNINLSLGLRLRGYERNDEELDGPFFAGTDSPFARSQTSSQLRLGATYMF